MVHGELTAGVASLAFGAVALVLAALVWTRRQGRTGAALAVVVVAVAGWDLAYGLELLSTDIDRQLLWGDLKYAGIGPLAPAWLAFTLCYTGRERSVTRRLVIALAVEPVLVLAALAVPATHDLVRYLPGGGAGGAGLARPVVAAGPLFWVHLAYADTMLLAATAVFVGSLARHSRAYWLQAAALTLAAVLPWGVNLLFNLQVAPFDRVDLTPMAFTASCLVLAWGLFRQQLLRLTPVARSVLVDRMADGVVVLDAYDHVVDANPAAVAMLGLVHSGPAGRPATQVLPAELLRDPDGPADDHVWWRRSAEQERAYEVSDTLLAGRAGHAAGRLLVLHDVSERLHLERRLRELLADQARVAEALAQSLRPAALPAVPGLRLAARFRPAGSGREIGGDFYDVFAVPGEPGGEPAGEWTGERAGEWAFAMGDVSGKGARAAAATASARYTLRALSSGCGPAEALRLLNTAVGDGAADETYLTVAHGRLRVGSGGVAVCLALGGHPQPLVVRRTGEVEPVGTPGSAIGLLAEVEVTAADVLLHEGDCLFLFSDGVTEARSTEGFFGDEALAACLAELAGQGAEAIASAVLQRVLDLQSGVAADDIAILVVEACGQA